MTSQCTSEREQFFISGTNDVGMRADGEKLLSTLCSMHDNARASGARTACLAMPQISVENVRP